MTNPDKSIWNDNRIKEMMENIAREEKQCEVTMDFKSIYARGTVSTSGWYDEPREKYYTERANSIAKEKKKEEEKNKPLLFDPDELDI